MVAIAWHFTEDYENLQVNHIDCDTKNNVPENLEWLTCKENINYIVDNNRHAFAMKVKMTNLENGEISYHNSTNRAIKSIGVKSIKSLKDNKIVIVKNHSIELI